MANYENIVDALDSVTWYNGLAKYVYQWTLPGYLERPGGIGYLTRINREDLSTRDAAQLEVIWMICVNLFGDYGTSPRSGWIEKSEEFCAFCKEITKTWQESEEGQDEMAEMEHAISENRLCFWCGKNKEAQTSLQGKWINGDYEPCDACKIKMNRGVTVVEASETPLTKNQVPYHGAYPTGKWLVMTERGIHKFCDEEEAKKAIERRMLFVDYDIYTDMTNRIRNAIRKGNSDD